MIMDDYGGWAARQDSLLLVGFLWDILYEK